MVWLQSQEGLAHDHHFREVCLLAVPEPLVDDCFLDRQRHLLKDFLIGVFRKHPLLVQFMVEVLVQDLLALLLLREKLSDSLLNFKDVTHVMRALLLKFGHVLDFPKEVEQVAFGSTRLRNLIAEASLHHDRMLDFVELSGFE